MIDHYEIGLQTEVRCLLEALEIVPYVKSAGDHLTAGLILCPDGQHIYYRYVLGIMNPGILEYVPYGGFGPAHYAFHSVAGSDVVALVDEVRAAHTHEDVLGVVGHSYHLVRHHLTYGQNQIERLVQQKLVHLGVHLVVQLAFRHLPDVRRRNHSYGPHVISPVVIAEQASGSPGEHVRNLSVCHRGVGTESRHHIGKAIAVALVNHIGDRPGEGVEPGVIRRDGHNPSLRPHSLEHRKQGVTHLFRGDDVRF